MANHTLDDVLAANGVIDNGKGNTELSRFEREEIAAESVAEQEKVKEALLQLQREEAVAGIAPQTEPSEAYLFLQSRNMLPGPNNDGENIFEGDKRGPARTPQDVQQDAIDRQIELFTNFEQGVNDRFDAQQEQNQRQFDAQETGITERLDEQQAGIQDRFDREQAGIRDRFETVQEQLNPFLASGERSIASLESLINDPNQITETPGFKFRFDQGQEAVQNAAAARGGGLGGNVLSALQAQGQGQASSELQNEFVRRNALFTGGQNTINSLISAIGTSGKESTAAFDLAGTGEQAAFDITGRTTANAFDRLGVGINAANQIQGTGLLNATTDQAGAIQTGATNISNLLVADRNLEEARRLGNRANRNSNILGIAQIGTALALGNPLAGIPGLISILNNQNSNQISTQPFTGTPQQSPLINQPSNPVLDFARPKTQANSGFRPR